ncbi:MAG TPA: FIST N-terminal domain-containing protein [Candidatus Binatia bacterium]
MPDSKGAPRGKRLLDARRYRSSVPRHRPRARGAPRDEPRRGRDLLRHSRLRARLRPDRARDPRDRGGGGGRRLQRCGGGVAGGRARAGCCGVGAGPARGLRGAPRLRSLAARPAEEVGRELGRVVATLDAEPKTLLLLADSYNLAPDELLAGVESAAPGTVVLGAGASEDGTIGETTVVGRGVASSNAVAGLAIGGLDVRSMVTQGGTPVGRWWKVTRAESNRILELDGEPALSVFLTEIPELLRADLREALRCTRAALADQITDGEETPPYVVRRLLGADVSQGALLVGDEVIPGMHFALAVRDPAAARESFARNVEEFAATSRDIAGALYFNSVERGEALYGIPDLDTAYLRRSLGDVEIAGFFSGAELAPLAGRNRFHQSSGVLVGFADG